jgi:serine phosphatase RsbU (regulator of sigma subunit)
VREAVNASDEEFGMERLCEAFCLAAPMGSEAVVARVQDDLRQFTGEGPQMDDITLVAIERKK